MTGKVKSRVTWNRLASRYNAHWITEVICKLDRIPLGSHRTSVRHRKQNFKLLAGRNNQAPIWFVLTLLHISRGTITCIIIRVLSFALRTRLAVILAWKLHTHHVYFFLTPSCLYFSLSLLTGPAANPSVSSSRCSFSLSTKFFIFCCLVYRWLTHTVHSSVILLCLFVIHELWAYNSGDLCSVVLLSDTSIMMYLLNFSCPIKNRLLDWPHINSLLTGYLSHLFAYGIFCLYHLPQPFILHVS